MEVVILAAGDGGRLYPRTASRPKAMVEVAGRPLIDHIIGALMEAGARRFLVVIGHHGEQLRDHLSGRADADFRFAWNRDADSGNAWSLAMAAPHLAPGEPFLLAMGDHLLSAEIAAAALAPFPDENYVLVDSRHRGIDDTLVQVGPGGVVLDIGKGLATWNATDTGLFRLRGDVHDTFAGLPPSAELNDGWRQLIDRRRLLASDVGGAWWADIDTESDLQGAEAALSEPGSHGVRRARLARP